MSTLDTWINDLSTNINPTKGTSSPVQVQAPTADVLAALIDIQGIVDDGTFPNGAAATPSINFVGSTTTGFYFISSGPGIGFSSSGVAMMTLQPSLLQQSVTGGGGLQSKIRGEGGTSTVCQRCTDDATGPNFTQQKNRGTIAAPTVVALGDGEGDYQWQPFTGTTNTTAARIRAVVAETGAVSATAIGTYIAGFTCPIGSGSLSEVFRWSNANGLQMFGTNTVIDLNRVFRNRVFTVATLPAAAAGQAAAVSDANATFTAGIGAVVAGGGANNVPVYNDGTNWRIG